MALVVVGVNPRRAPFSLLVRSLESPGARTGVLAHLAGHRSVSEALVLLCGQRAEVYAVVEDGTDAYDVIPSSLVASGVLAADGAAHGYFAEGTDAAAHLFAAVAGVDEFACADEGVAAAFAQAASASRAQGALGSGLESLAVAARSLAARLETPGAGESAEALGETVAELARRVFDHLDRRRALAVGAGALPVAAVRALAAAGVGHFTWVGAPGGGTQPDTGVPAGDALPTDPETAALSRGPSSFASASPEALPVLLGTADVVVVAPGVTPALDKRLVKTAMRTRRGRPMLLVDVSEGEPAIEARVASVDDAFLYTRADLMRLTDDAPWACTGGASARNALIAEAVRNFSYQLA